MQQKGPEYSALGDFAEQWQIHTQKDPDHYTDIYGSVLFLRWYNMFRKQVEDVYTEQHPEGKPPGVRHTLAKVKKEYGLPLKTVSLKYHQLISIYRKLSQGIDVGYNTEDGQIRWLQDHGYDLHLGSFWTILPINIKEQMPVWKYMQLPLSTTVEVRKKLEDIGEEYNTEDGQIRWLEDQGYNLHLGHFWSILPAQIMRQMGVWKNMNLSLAIAVEVRKKLEDIGKEYNTEDGQIRWLQDQGYGLHLGSFWGIIPAKIKKQMSTWQKMDPPLSTVVEVRKKLEAIGEEYNTEDGQIRWLQDHSYHINLGSFWKILPTKSKKQMNVWQKMDVPLKVAVEVRKKLEDIGEEYNTEDGQIRWLQDHGYDLHLGSFWGIIPAKVKGKMSAWQKKNLSLSVTVEVRKKLEEIGEKYNTEDGQIRWLQDHGYDLHLGHFWSILPPMVRKQMGEWQRMNLPLSMTVEVRKKLEDIGEEYNTEDGQIRWLEDQGYALHLGHFWTVLPTMLKKQMSAWQKMDLPLFIAAEIRRKLQDIGQEYNTEDGQVRWLQYEGYDSNLGNFWSVIPFPIREKMTAWRHQGVTFEEAKQHFHLK